MIPLDLRKERKSSIMVRTAITFFAVFVILLLFFNVQFRITKSKLFELQREAGELQVSVAEYNRLKEESAAAEALLQEYKNVFNRRAGAGEIFEGLHTIIPEDSWLTNIEITAGKEVVLTGYIPSLTELGVFTSLLSEQKYFSSSQLKNVQEEEHNNLPFFMFTIICKLSDQSLNS